MLYLITMLALFSVKPWQALTPVAVDGFHTFSMNARVNFAGSCRKTKQCYSRRSLYMKIVHFLQTSCQNWKKALTWVAQCCLWLHAPLVIPLSCLFFPFYVHFNAVLRFPHVVFTLPIVGFAFCPVGGFCCERLVRPDPGPDVLDLADPDPVVGVFPGQPAVQVPNLLLVLDSHHVRVLVLAPGSSRLPVHGGVWIEVRPALHTAPHAQDW